MSSRFACLGLLLSVLTVLFAWTPSVVAQQPLPEIEINEPLTVRESRPVNLALEAAFIVAPPADSSRDDVELNILPGLRFNYTALSWLAFEARFHSLLLVNTLQVGMRWWILDSKFTPSLFVLAGGGHTVLVADDDAGGGGFGNESLFALGTLGASIDYVTDDGVTFALELAGVLADLNGQPLNVSLTPAVGYRF